jgi:hypothetical protein
VLVAAVGEATAIVGLSERRGTDEIQGLWPAGGAAILAETHLILDALG